MLDGPDAEQMGSDVLFRCMRKLLLVLLVLAVSATLAEARWRHYHYRHHRHHHYVVVHHRGAAPGQKLLNPPLLPADTADRSPPDYGDVGDLVPADWKLQPPDPNWKGKRFVSPDGASWFAAYPTPVGQETIAAHMKAVAFVDGETVAYLRGGRDWIAVSGTKGDRIFYRKAVLACAGKSWHHVAFEYPQSQKRNMDEFIARAAHGLDHTENDGCGSVISRQ
jgi:serine/threonine-protein kinase